MKQTRDTKLILKVGSKLLRNITDCISHLCIKISIFMTPQFTCHQPLSRYKIVAVEQGFNTDLTIKGQQYHVQTEDWGEKNPYFVSRVYRGGAVLKSVKISYEDILPRGLSSGPKAIRLALELQHKKILDLLVSGQLF